MTTITMEEYELMKDSKYRMYVAAVDKALKNFEYSSEWADLISALIKLNKVLTSYTKFPVIPRRIKISKRLAQCMHPALPPGVHLRALETYDSIFRCMGTARLSQELFIYSAGLFPLLGHAAMNVRPTLLFTYETHFVPLRERLRPALNGFLSGVLPGLETGSDYFDRTTRLLENVCDGVGPIFFYTTIWQCVTNNSPIRLPAIAYVLSHHSRKIPMDDQLYIMGSDIDLMVRGLCAAVQDTSVLVQRAALDLLIACLPMRNNQLVHEDMVKLATAALTSILRRDMSLNRRLYAWLLERSDTLSSQLTDNSSYSNDSKSISTATTTESVSDNNSTGTGYELMKESLRIILHKSCTEMPPDIRPYRLMTSLFEKPLVGPTILDSVLLEVFRAVYLTALFQQKRQTSKSGGGGAASQVRCVSFTDDHVHQADAIGTVLDHQFANKQCKELIKNANLLFSTLQTYFIWSYLERMYIEAVTIHRRRKRITPGTSRIGCVVNDIGSGPPDVLEVCRLTDFLLDVIPLETELACYSEKPILPSLFKTIINTLHDYISQVDQFDIEYSLETCRKILSKIQPPVLAPLPSNTQQPTQGSNDSVVDVDLLTDGVNSTQRNGPLEKSKSDSRINQFEEKRVEKIEVYTDNRERSYSNQMHVKLAETSNHLMDSKPKSHSSSRLHELIPNSEADGEANNTAGTDPVLTAVPDDMVSNVTSAQSVHIPNSENRWILDCLNLYKQFFIVFVESKLMSNTTIGDCSGGTSLRRFVQQFVCDRNERTNHLIKLLQDCLASNDSHGRCTIEPINVNNINPNPSCAEDKSKCENISDTCSRNGSKKEVASNYEGAMKMACNILLEFSALPYKLLDCDTTTNANKGLGDATELPNWLEALIVCACLDNNSVGIQITSMSTILELFSLPKSENTTNVVISGILQVGYVTFIEENTIIIEEMSRILWNLLGILTNEHQLVLCVSLLYQIHNTFDQKNFVENIICRFMSSEHITANYMKQFFLLWHLGRDLAIKLPPGRPANIRHFDRSLLKILDNLMNVDQPHLQLLSQSFVTHCLLHNDIGRLITPILLKLLSPNTARVSIRHISVHDSGTRANAHRSESQSGRTSNGGVASTAVSESSQIPSNEQHAKKIYAVSNVNGNVMYHVTESASLNASPKHSSKRKWFAFSKSNKNKFSPSSNRRTTTATAVITLPTDAGSSVVDGRKLVITSKSSSSKTTPSSNSVTATTSSGPVKLIINPLSSKEIYSDSVEGLYSKLSHSPPPTFFTVSSSDSSSTESLSSTTANDISTCDTGVDMTTLTDAVDPLPTGKQVLKSRSFDEHTHHLLTSPTSDDLSQSWSYSQHEDNLEVSTTAEDYFKGDQKAVQDVLDHVLDSVCRRNAAERRANRRKAILFAIHSHICLYCEVFDSHQVLYALQTLGNCLQCQPQLFIKFLASNGLSVCGVQSLSGGSGTIDVISLLARHRKSMLGEGFTGDNGNEYTSFFRGYMLLDLVVTICLTYARSFYPPRVPLGRIDDVDVGDEEDDDDDDEVDDEEEMSSSFQHVSESDIEYNVKIQLESINILNVITRNLIAMIDGLADHSKGFATYIADMLSKCKLQKILLHCLLTSVRSCSDQKTFAEEILMFNQFVLVERNGRVGGYVEAFQIQLLRLIHSLIVLEHAIYPHTRGSPNGATNGDNNNVASSTANTSANNTPLGAGGNVTSDSNLNYAPTVLIAQQPIFLSAVMSALRDNRLKGLHEPWLNMITSCMPYFGSNLKQITISVIHQLCSNIEDIARSYGNSLSENEDGCNTVIVHRHCVDYAITQLEALTVLCHYALLDTAVLAQTFKSHSTFGLSLPNGSRNGVISTSSGITSLSTNGGASSSNTNTAATIHGSGGSSSGTTNNVNSTSSNTLLTPSNPGELFSNLVSAFFAPLSHDASTSNSGANRSRNATDELHYQAARKCVLSHMPRIISSVAKLWQIIINLLNNNVSYDRVYGNAKTLKQQLLAFLSPISVHHSASFVAAVAVAWHERRTWSHSYKTVLPESNSGQNNLVYLISAIRVIPLDNLVQTVTSIIKNPPPIEGISTDICLDVAVLELFYCYMRNASATQLSEAWSSLLTLIREGCSLGAQAQFLLAAVLHELMIKCCPMDEKKDQKDLQDVTAKLIECVSQVCGSCLEQTTWLRRNLAVRETPDYDRASHASVESAVGTGSQLSLQSNNHNSYTMASGSGAITPTGMSVHKDQQVMHSSSGGMSGASHALNNSVNVNLGNGSHPSGNLNDATITTVHLPTPSCASLVPSTMPSTTSMSSLSSPSLVRVSMSGDVSSRSLSNSVQAQLVLSEILAPILDICFGSSEKDKVVAILTSLMYNIVPYLKTHTLRNMSSFNACSKLLASLSSYQYTRKAWRKDVFDLIMDNNFFQMDHSSLQYWRIIVDNLMTHDNTTFKDLMNRVTLNQSGSLSIFSSREQEYEQRAQLLKRLAYVIFCSEMDQYCKYLPDIQEQLTTSLKLNVPGVQAQVFLCFRVILIRLSACHVTSLWPIIISEMLQVFLQIEQELSTDSDEFSAHIKLMSTLDASWATNSSNGLHALGHPHWLRLQLAAAKLLDLTLLLPAVKLPQFQMYRWAFVGCDSTDNLNSFSGSPTSTFIPHVVRIAGIMDRKFSDNQIETIPMRNELLLTTNHITHLKELHSFFKTLSLCANIHRVTSENADQVLEKIDSVVEMDFLDKIPR